MRSGERDKLITVQRAPTVTDEYGGEIPDWDNAIKIEDAWAHVRFGLASEQRQAAQEGGTQVATFEVDPTTALLAVMLKDRIVFDGSNWDISEKAPLNRNTLRFTAKRSL